MQPHAVLIFSFCFIFVNADLTCLGWGLISPIVGLFCHFEPEYFQTAENDTVAAVKDAIESTKDLVQFDLTHNPAVVTYDFLEETSNGGLAQGGQYLRNISRDFGDVTIGFGKETANQLITIVELSYWNDISMCLISGAGGLVSQAKRRRRALIPSTTDAVSMAQGCISPKLKQFASPATFHLNGTNQKIGSTIANLAGLLVPVGAEEKVGAQVAESLDGAVDLAIPGSESTTRVVKKVGDNTADHFANEAEANAVAEKMRDKDWLDENCGICGVSPPPLGDVIDKREIESIDHVARRGVIVTSCCSVPPPPKPGQVGADTAEESEFREAPKGLIHNPADYRFITEDELVPPPQLPVRDIRFPDDAADISKDLTKYSTSLVDWSTDITEIMTSDQLFSTLRKIFTRDPEDPLYKALGIQVRDKGLRKTSISWRWDKSNDPALKRLQQFVKASLNHGIDVVSALKAQAGQDGSGLEGEMEFFYTAPNSKALTGTDPRGFHIDGGMMQFGIADVPGLIVVSTASGKASRVTLQENAFHMLKARFWDIQAWYRKTPQGPTWHSVFGPEMAREGRVSVVMTIYKKKVKDW